MERLGRKRRRGRGKRRCRIAKEKRQGGNEECKKEREWERSEEERVVEKLKGLRGRRGGRR